MCDTAKIEHSTANRVHIYFVLFFLGGGVGVGGGGGGGGGGSVSLHNHTWKAKTEQNILGYFNVIQ